MELTITAIALVPIVLLIYMVTEESILRRYRITDTIEDWEDLVEASRLWEDQRDAEYTLLDRLTNIIRW